jgi:hypothetical protein
MDETLPYNQSICKELRNSDDYILVAANGGILHVKERLKMK